MQNLSILLSRYGSALGGMLVLGGFVRNRAALAEWWTATDAATANRSGGGGGLTAEPKVLVLGWYNRHNLGDDCFADAFRQLFANCSVACTDDLTAIPSDVDVVVCGGGDIVNPYFMTKIERLLYDYKGPCYGVGIGVPFDADAPRALAFDHSFARSGGDLALLCGAGSATQTADLSWLLPRPPPRADLLALSRPQVGLCLAQPAFHNNPAAPQLLAAVVDVIASLTESGCDVHLLSFNTSSNASESDALLAARLMDELLPPGCLAAVRAPVLETHADMMAYMGGMRALLCMRYHSVQFALQMRRPFAAMYSTSKVDKLLRDVGFEAYGYRLPTDATSRPTAIDAERVLALLDMCVGAPNTLADDMEVSQDAIRSTVYGKLRRDPVAFDALEAPSAALPRSVEDARARCIAYAARLTGWSEAAARQWFYDGGGAGSETLARTLLLAATGHVASAYVWGMCEQMQREGAAFRPAAAIDWVYSDVRARHVPAPLPALPQPFDVCVDLSYYLQDDFKEFHRSGWSYCIGGLMRFDTTVLRRRPSVRVDTYVDRTFHWGKDALKAAGIVPYTQPWMGFIHHTFEQSHGPNNCVTLFQDADFLQSLQTCRCLIVLSEYLAGQVRTALAGVGFPDVPVEVMTHAMEFVPTESCFTFDNLMASQENRYVVAIGAWLRNPYAIYELPVTNTFNNKFQIQKAVLRGKDMNSCMAPDWLPEAIADLNARCGRTGASSGMCRPAGSCGGGICRPSGSCGAGICRPYGSCGAGICRPATACNFMVAGMVDMLQRQLASVTTIPQLSNAEYDHLLSCNIVFLNLVDCSAVNTVLECIVRNTIVIVNRLPALEEALGSGYPGFYDTLDQAAFNIKDTDQLRCAYEYLVGLNKEKLKLVNFQHRFVEIVKAHQ